MNPLVPASGDASTQSLLTDDTPRGLQHVTLDEHGRLKFPPQFRSYLTRQGERKIFATVLVEGVLWVYPVTIWCQRRAALAAAGTRAAKSVHFLAEDRGRDVSIDQRGRVTIHPDLLKLLGQGRQEVVLEFFRGRVNIYNQTAYHQEQERAREALDDDSLSALEQQGLL